MVESKSSQFDKAKNPSMEEEEEVIIEYDSDGDEVVIIEEYIYETDSEESYEEELINELAAVVYPGEVYSPEQEIRVEPEKEPNYYEAQAEATKSMYYTHSGSGEEPVNTEPLLAKEDQIGNGEEDPLAKKRRRRCRRRVRMTVGGTAGLIVGAVVCFGPLGPFVGATAGAVGARVISKRREQRKDERVASEDIAAADSATPTEMSEAVLT
jgi:hypothetical protein